MARGFALGLERDRNNTFLCHHTPLYIPLGRVKKTQAVILSGELRLLLLDVADQLVRVTKTLGRWNGYPVASAALGVIEGVVCGCVRRW